MKSKNKTPMALRPKNLHSSKSQQRMPPFSPSQVEQSPDMNK